MSRSFSGFGRPCTDEEPSELLVDGIRVSHQVPEPNLAEPDLAPSPSLTSTVNLAEPDSGTSQTQQMTSTVELTVE
jgi:hypothetical protein